MFQTILNRLLYYYFCFLLWPLCIKTSIFNIIRDTLLFIFDFYLLSHWYSQPWWVGGFSTRDLIWFLSLIFIPFSDNNASKRLLCLKSLYKMCNTGKLIVNFIWKDLFNKFLMTGWIYLLYTSTKSCQLGVIVNLKN